MAETPSVLLHRRDVFKFGLLAAVAGLAPAPALAEVPTPLSAPSWRVVVDIPGLPEASGSTFAVEIDPLEIDVEAHGRRPNGEFRVFGPGQAHWGHASLTSASTLGGSKELQAWFTEVVSGRNIRKNITVTLKSDESPGRSYNLMDCFPTQWSSVNFDTSSSVQTETLRVKVGRIEFKPSRENAMAGAALSDRSAQVTGFRVEIDNAGGKDDDTGWEHVSGGAVMIEHTETTIGSDKFHTHSPGHRSVEEITLRGAMTAGRSALSQWINDTVQGREWRRTLTITELLSAEGWVKDGKSYVYYDCFPVGYVFPRIDPRDPCARVEEELRFVYRRLVVVEPKPNA